MGMDGQLKKMEISERHGEEPRRLEYSPSLKSYISSCEHAELRQTHGHEPNISSFRKGRGAPITYKVLHIHVMVTLSFCYTSRVI
jgi:hypothetical protein